jgi:cytidine deaminase
MSNIEWMIDKMFLKRFCLPAGTDVMSYENGMKNINSCICGHYNHVSCVFQGKGFNVLSYGVNIYSDVEGRTPGIHAEHDAISKLPYIKGRKRLEDINILVVRLSKTNKIQSSKPCYNCIKMMSTYPKIKGYKIRHIYYSNVDGTITRSTLNKLETEQAHYSRYYKNVRYIKT